MVRTQIQLPDDLHERAKQLAEEKEISLAEIVRRGLEYLLMIYPPNRAPKAGWKLDPPANTRLKSDPFADPDWRMNVNSGETRFATANIKDFKVFGFENVWNPLS